MEMSKFDLTSCATAVKNAKQYKTNVEWVRLIESWPASWQALECKCRIITEWFRLEGTSVGHAVLPRPQSSTSVSRLSCLGSCSACSDCTGGNLHNLLFSVKVPLPQKYLLYQSFLGKLFLWHTGLVPMEFSEDINGEETNKCQSSSIQVTFDCLF